MLDLSNFTPLHSRDGHHFSSGAQPQWGVRPTSSGTGGGGGGFGDLFKPIVASSSQKNHNRQDSGQPSSPSKGSQANNSSETDPTSPITTSTGGKQSLGVKGTGMSSAPDTPGGHNSSNVISAATGSRTGGGTSAAIGGSTMIANFWNNHAMPATACDGGVVPAANSTSPQQQPSPPNSSPLSDSAKAAADAVMGMISRTGDFIASGGGCSPRTSPKGFEQGGSVVAAMEGIPEEGVARGAAAATARDDNAAECGRNCFEFEEFGFNAFQAIDENCDDQGQQRQQHNDKNMTALESRGPPATDLTTSSPDNKGYEIRLKSTFSNVRAQKENKSGGSGKVIGSAFGRTHPNNSKKAAVAPIPTQQIRQTSDAAIYQQQQQQDDILAALPDDLLPIRELSVPTEIERSVSELTMRSHGAFERHRYTSDSRRMAYYAVGRTTANNDNKDDDDGNNKSSGGGNRRCYFTGKPIPYGMPFYAGSVQQGPRTLVVFCLPSALGLPRSHDGITQSTPLHRFSNKADRDNYIESLPPPDVKFMQEMSERYPEPFDTLPVQVRSPHCWRLFVKFCFFSGLPIAEGEMHYRVKSAVRSFPPNQHQQLGEEIALSHEVMEGKMELL